MGTNSPHIDVAHVAPAMIDAKYIAVNCSCILLKFRSDMSHINSKITVMQLNVFIYKKDDVRLALAYQNECRVEI